MKLAGAPESNFPTVRFAYAAAGRCAPTLRRSSGFPGRRQEIAYCIENARGDRHRLSRLPFVRFSRSIEVPEYDGVVGQIGSLLERRGKGRIQCGALAAKFVQVMRLVEEDVVKCEEGFGSLLGRLLAVERRSGRFRRCQQARGVEVLPVLRVPAIGLVTPRLFGRHRVLFPLG